MDKQSYKRILSNSISEATYYKDLIKKIELTVKDTPNDMQLGKKIRNIFWEIFTEESDRRDIEK